MKVNLSVKAKLFSLIGLGGLVLFLILGINYFNNKKIGAALLEYKSIFKLSEYFDNLEDDINQIGNLMGKATSEKISLKEAANSLYQLTEKTRRDGETFLEEAAHYLPAQNLDELKNYLAQLPPKLNQAASFLKKEDLTGFKNYLREDLSPYLDEFEGLSTTIAKLIEQRSTADYQEIVSSVKHSETENLIVSILALLGLLAVGFFISQKISLNLNRITQELQKISRGRFENAVPVASKDELGTLARACNSLITGVGQILKTLEVQTQALTRAAQNLTRVENTVDENAQDIGHFAREVAAAAEQVTENLKIVAQSIEELNVATQESAQNVNETANIAQDAREKAEVATRVIAELKESSQKIGQIVQVINQIADQTNLLALNATIEAARAGEAGKGFAVVANEVKELARQTSEATDEIASMIGSIQANVDQAVEAVNSVDEIISKIGDLSSNIASATEEQTATTQDISRSVQEGISGVVQVNYQIQTLAEKASRIEKITAELKLAEEAISDIVAEIKTVNDFFTVREEALDEASKEAEEGVRVMGMTFQHFQWRERLLEGILAYQKPQVQTDASLCALGRWLKEFRPHNAEQEGIINQLVPAHQELHQSAVEVIQLIENRAESEKIFQVLKEKISPKVHTVVGYLKELRASLERAA